MRFQAQSAFEEQSGKFSKFALGIWDHSVTIDYEIEQLQVCRVRVCMERLNALIHGQQKLWGLYLLLPCAEVLDLIKVRP